MKRRFFVVFGCICPKERLETQFRAKWVEMLWKTDIIVNYRQPNGTENEKHGLSVLERGMMK